MTRYAIDAPTALRFVTEGHALGAGHTLVAPSLLRSHALSALYRDVREGRLDAKAGRARLEGVTELKIRLLGDRVSRARAWALAEQLGWDDTPLAEYLAVAALQADALVTDDPRLVAGAEGVVDVAPFDDLLR
ncbi:hypothetical protein [Georgenia faecalis]|uniref:PIN domain-containing protein n=1 Tax=Georgenia faecalis TaxID=2483799 RepID=A0ABV9D798_9MICO|nr:hypothetical protein [Georgenia faecalis]